MNFFKKHTVISVLLLYFIIGISWGIIYQPSSLNSYSSWDNIIGITFVAAIWPYIIFLSLISGGEQLIYGVVGLVVSMAIFIFFALLKRRANQIEAAASKK